MPPDAADACKANGEPVPTSRRGRTAWRRAAKLLALCSVLFAVVIVPFLLLGEMFDEIVSGVIAVHKPLAALTGFCLLAADIVLPIPSTVVVTVLGGLLGTLGGTLVAAGGLTLGCLMGYWLGRRLGFGFAERTMGRADFDVLSGWFDRYGVVVLACCRPVPVLAEASVIAAGVMGLAIRKALVVTTFANIGFAAVYASLGANSETLTGFFAAVAASIVLPLAAVMAAKAFKSRSRSA